MSKLVIDLKMNVITVGDKIVIDMNEEKIMVNMDGEHGSQAPLARAA